jgi:biopolymer transport protein ExbB/TolQ/biopolymer transport protein ExbD
MHNLDLQALLNGGPVMLPLFVCSVVAVAVMIERFLTIGVTVGDNEALMSKVTDLVKQGKTDEAIALCRKSPGRSAALIADAIENKDLDLVGVERVLQETAGQMMPQLTERMSVLDTIITIAPLLGLLGTVTGMIRAFHIFQGLGAGTNPAKITGGVAEALIATASGLAIAIIVLVAYNYLSERIKLNVVEMETRAAQVLNLLIGLRGKRITPNPSSKGLTLPRIELKRARIEIIPMIDTIFFLLVFFMITSLAMVHMDSHKVTLPSSSTADLKPSEMIVLTISQNGQYYLGQDKINLGDIRNAVAAKVAENPSLPVVINCDKDQSMADFDRVFDLIKQANPAQVMVATEPQATQ